MGRGLTFCSYVLLEIVTIFGIFNYYNIMGQNLDFMYAILVLLAFNGATGSLLYGTDSTSYNLWHAHKKSVQMLFSFVPAFYATEVWLKKNLIPLELTLLHSVSGFVLAWLYLYEDHVNLNLVDFVVVANSISLIFLACYTSDVYVALATMLLCSMYYIYRNDVIILRKDPLIFINCLKSAFSLASVYSLTGTVPEIRL